MKKRTTALLLCMVLMLGMMLSGCRNISEESEGPRSYDGESFYENFNTPTPVPTVNPSEEVAEKLSTQEALKQKKNLQFIRADANTGLVGDNQVKNILILGQDRRKGDKNQMRTDCMMIFSINTGTNQVSLVSLMRDMYVPLSNGKEGLLNTAYMDGGIDLLSKTIEKDFGVHIDHYIEADFWRFMDLFKLLGAVGIDLESVEAKYLNGDGQKLREAFSGAGDGQKSWNLVEGRNLLDYEQLLCYCRTREIGNGDWERTARQRKVIHTVFDMIMGYTNSKLIRTAQDAHPYFVTNMSQSDMLGYLYALRTREITQVNEYRLPVDGSYTQETKETEKEKWEVLVPNVESNKKALQQFLGTA